MLTALRRGRKTGPVFRTMHGGQWRNNVRRGFVAIVARSGIPHCTIHDLRRTFCTLVSSIAGPKDVQTLAGHASLETTMTYYVASLHERSAQEIAKRMPI